MTDSRTTTHHGPGLSIVIPAYNEADSIPELMFEIQQSMEAQDFPWEVIFIDDGSSDGTLVAMRDAARGNKRVTVIPFTRNQGKSAAYTTAFEIAKYPLVATMDADLQDDPHELSAMIQLLHSGWDLVVGYKQGRMGNEAKKAIPSRLFNKWTSLVFGLKLHDYNSGLRVMRREVCTDLDLYSGRYRFIPALARLQGFRVTEQPVHHRKRKFGKSKFGPSRFLTGLLDIFSIRIISLFNQRPFHLFGSIGLILFLVGTGLAGLTLYRKIWNHDLFSNHFAAIISAATCAILAVHFAAIGIIGELLLVVSRRQSRRSIQENHNLTDTEA